MTPFDDATRLSIVAAARDAGDRPAIVTATRSWTFAECARAVAEQAHAAAAASASSDGAHLAAAGARAIADEAYAAAVAPRHADDARAAAITATPSVDTILAVYTALEARRPLALVHGKVAPGELARQRAAVASAQLPGDTAFVLFTSGSTGAARGVVLSRRAILAAADASASRLGWRDDDRWLSCLPMAHAGGLSIVVRCLTARRPVVLHDGDFDAARVAALARDARVTIASLVPAQLDALAGPHAPASADAHRDGPRAPAAADARHDGTREPTSADGRRAPAAADARHAGPHAPPPALRAVVLGGAAAAPSLVADAVARGWPVFPSYGLTETFGQVATALAPGGPPVVLPGVELVAGETLRVRGPMLATAYLDGTPIAPELITADLGSVDPDGTVHVHGRRDDVIVTGGEKVHPLEVEAVLAATPGVRAACAFAVADARWGHVVGAAIASDAAFDRAAALAHWHAALSAHARPRRLAVLVALPQLASGKLDRRAIAQLATVPIVYRDER